MIKEDFNCSNESIRPVKLVCSLLSSPEQEMKDWYQFSAKKNNVGVVVAPSFHYCYQPLIDALSMFKDIPSSVNVIYIVSGYVIGREHYPVIEKIMSYQGNRMLYDEIGQYEALIQPDEIYKTEYNHVIVNRLPETMDEKLYNEHVLMSDLAEKLNFLRHVVGTVSDSIKTASELISYAQDCFSLLTGNIIDFPIEKEELECIAKMFIDDFESYQKIICDTKSNNCKIFTKETEENHQRLLQAGNFLRFSKNAIAVSLIRANLPLMFAPYAMKVKQSIQMCDEEQHKMLFDMKPIRTLFDSLGVYAMVEAFYEGVPEKDILT